MEVDGQLPSAVAETVVWLAAVGVLGTAVGVIVKFVGPVRRWIGGLWERTAGASMKKAASAALEEDQKQRRTAMDEYMRDMEKRQQAIMKQLVNGDDIPLVQRVEGIQGDVTELRHFAQTQEEMHRHIVDLTGEAIMYADGSQQTVWVSEGTCILFGAEPYELLGTGWTNFIVERFLDDLNSKWNAAFEAGAEAHWEHIEYYRRLPDGTHEHRAFRSWAKPMKSTDPERPHFIGRLFDKGLVEEPYE